MADNDTLKVALVTLAEQHLKTLRDTVQHILSTHRAECVFAQVAEGVSTQETAQYKLHDLDPQIKDRTKPALEALDLVKNWRSEFHLETLEIDEKVLQAYKDSRPGTKEFKLRLIETTAVVIHSLAALLFEHTNEQPYKCPEPERKIVIVDGLPEVTDEIIGDPIPTYLYHDDYLDHDLYPMGVADVVAYWAETHLFGGVVVFDHGESDTEFLDVFLHPDCSFKAFKLSDAQVDQFVSFGLYGEPAVPSPFPIKPGRDAVRLLPEFTMQKNIYRTKSDRRIPELPSGWHPVGRLEDDPQMMEFMDKYKNGDWTYGYNEI